MNRPAFPTGLFFVLLFASVGNAQDVFRATWVGRDADIVSKGSEIQPDGEPDGHFHIQTSFSAWREVAYVALRSADASGNPAGGQVWHTRDAGSWILGVVGDQWMNARSVMSLGRFIGPVGVDLYAGDSGWFNPGQTFVVEMGLDGNEVIEAVVRIAGANAPLASAPGAPGSGVPTTPAANPAAGPPVPADWNTRGDARRGEAGTRYSYTCPPNGTIGPVWGTDVYTDDTSVCTAAVHAGLITLAGGGTVTIELRGAEPAFRGEARNGITSWNYGAWERSFVFPRPGDPPATPPLAGGAQGGVPTSGGALPPTDGAQTTTAGGGPTPLGGASSRLTALQAAWIGLDDDLVQPGSEVRPDGSRDGHFRVDASFSFWQDVTYFALFSADEAGNKAGGQVWHSRDSAFWVLAVLVDGMNLNTRHLPLLGAFHDNVTFDLYAPDSGVFRPGQTVLVEIGLDGAAPQTRVVRIGEAPAAEAPPAGGAPSPTDPTQATNAGGAPTSLGGSSSRLTSLAASWVGLDGDVVQRGAEVRPDGSMDGHVRVDASFSFWQDVTYLALFSADEAGNKAGGQVWHSRDAGYWILGALVDGMNLNTRHVPLLGAFRDAVTFDLYAGDSGAFRPGQMLLVEIGLDGADPETRLVRIGDANAPLAGAPGAGAPASPSGGAPTTPVSGGPPAVESGGPPAPADWNTRGDSRRGEAGTRYSYTCPPNGTIGPVWGTDVYTDDTSVCTAAVHAGLITLAGGGTVTIELRGAEPAYRGETRNGITSWSYGAWERSFVFPRPGDPPAAATPAGGTPSAGAPTAGGAQAGGAQAGGAPTGATTAAANAQRERYGAGEPIVVEFRGFPGSAQDWIDISPAGAPEESYGAWSYLGGRTTGSLEFQGLTAGAYEVRGRFNWPEGGFAVRTRSTFTVVADQPPTAGNALRGPEICGVWRWFDRSIVVFDADGGLAATGVNAPSLMLVDRGRWELVDPARRQYRIVWPVGQDLLTLSPDENGLGGTNVGGAVQVSATRTGACGAAPPSPPGDFDAQVSYDAEWVGMDADYVSAGSAATPDGAADGHFRFTYDTDIGPYEVRSIAVMSSDAAGNPTGGQVWTTGSSGTWVLGVVRQGTRLNDGHVPSLGTHQGLRSFDLYAADSGWFQPGQHFVVEVDMGRGAPIRQVVRIPESLDEDVAPQAEPTAPPPSAPEDELPVPSPMFAGSISLERAVYGDDEPVRVTFQDFRGDERIVVADADAEFEQYITGVWPDGSRIGGTPPASPTREGSVAFIGFLPGEYEIRVFTESPEEGQWPQLVEPFVVESAAALEPPEAPAPQRPVNQPPSQPPAEEYRVTGLSAAWIGVDADVVSTVTVSPDGAADGHFAIDLTLEGSPLVSYATVYSSDASGNPSGGQIWHSQSPSYAVLAVSAWGHLLNSGYVSEIGRFSAGNTRLDLYGFDSGWFRPGQHFVVELGFADGQKVARVVQVTGAAPPPAAEVPAAPPAAQYRVTGLTATWIGMDADVVSVGIATIPDGAPDGRIALEVGIEGSAELRSVTLYSSDAQGNPEGGQVWTTASGTSWWVLGVGAGGRLLHTGQVEALGLLQSGTTWLDLFAGNSGWFNPGQNFLVELAFSDGQKAAAVVRVTGGAAPGPVAPPPAAAGAPGACDVSGLWHGNIQGFGASDWTFTLTGRDQYAVQETGLGNARGTATVSGYRLQFDWQTGDFTGTAVLDLDARCMSASGQDIFHTGGQGAHAMTLQRAGAAAAPAPTGGALPTQDFTAPMWGGVRLDWCLVWGGQCGEPAATEFCRQSGYTKATAWEPAVDVGTQTPTFVIGTGQTCNEPGCDGFTSISCAR